MTDILYEDIEKNYYHKSDLSCYSHMIIDIIDNFKNANIAIRNYPILIYRYHQYTCESCVQNDLNLLEEILLKDIGKEHILILPAYTENRDNKIRLSNYLHKFNFINITEENFYIPSDCYDDTARKRYFILIDKKGNIEDIFFPEKYKSNLIHEFLLSAKDLFTDIPSIP